VIGSDLLRRKETRLNLEAQASKLSPYLAKPTLDVSRDVLEKSESWTDFFEDSPEVWPEVSSVSRARALTCC